MSVHGLNNGPGCVLIRAFVLNGMYMVVDFEKKYAWMINEKCISISFVQSFIWNAKAV